MDEIIICQDCGRGFKRYSLTGKKPLRCEDCRRITANRQASERKREKRLSRKTLLEQLRRNESERRMAEKVIAAKEADMSYGQLVAMRRREAMKREEALRCAIN